MIKEALQYIVGLRNAEIIEVDGFKYSDKALSRVFKPLAGELKLTTLTGLVDYVKGNIDKIEVPLLLHIESPNRVTLYSNLNGDRNREEFIQCNTLLPQCILNRFVDLEAFNIMLQSAFVRNEDTEIVLKVVGNVKDETVQEYGDDGVSQKVTIKSGVAKFQDVKVPNPVILAPYRTFAEVPQPESRFIFRMRKGGEVGLFEADGGAWRNIAMDYIKQYLSRELEGVDDITIIS